ncbi:hypothetical protein H8S90_11605 [Olivibacter sp. SDN3]|uniref:hypothetical protein n=1 Tax=Olivibacter sp. SDN3 TaxID=2764720 RepID=UPI0016510BCA|nr:hypothetical protein [Olivibacter sp. SDN3]QNL52161.1 hypothetical protein H8S90_11605 [Olivibacter sp. SDN3]
MIRLVLIILVCSCGNQHEKNRERNSEGASPVIQKKQEGSASATDSIMLQLEDGQAKKTVPMEKGKRITFVFEIKKAPVVLFVKVVPEQPGGNVRLAQIFMPDGSADGPFGNQMEYKLSQTGLYRIVVAENQMVGTPYYGKFNLSVNLK